jgi:hypothetical protein
MSLISSRQSVFGFLAADFFLGSAAFLLVAILGGISSIV